MMSSTMSLVLNYVVALILTLSVADAVDLKAYAWQSKSAYPTADDFPENDLLSSRASTAVAFTGGGSRSYLASLGYLAAFKQLGLTDIRYISGVSGGSWATVVYSYKQTDVDDEEFLGTILYPNEITMEKLEEMPPKCARSLTDCDFVKVTLEAVKDGTVNSLAEGKRSTVHPCSIMYCGIHNFYCLYFNVCC